MNKSEPLTVRISSADFRLFTEIFRFFLRWCLVVILWMRAFLIIKLNIILYCRSEFFFGTVFCTVKLFALHIWKEALHNGIVVWNMRSWKWMCNSELFQIFTERFWSVITPVIGMKNQIFIRLPWFISQLESTFCQLCAVFTAYLISYNLPCIQVDNNTNIIILFVISEAGNIADPDFVWARCMELPVQMVFVLTFSLS